ncbi:MAG: exopolysaccharide biosynthesis protein [Pseudoxanthomonas sp.]
MTISSPEPAVDSEPDTLARTAGTRAVLDAFAAGDPDDHLRLGDLLSGLRQTAFGMLLFVAVLPAFIPIPGVAGAVSGPLVVLIGMQLLICLRKPWLPGFLAKRGPHRKTMIRFRDMMSRWLGWLEKLVTPRLSGVLDHPVASAFTGLLLVLLGILLALPIPFTNYLFGVLLLLFVFALLERDGALMLVAWLAGTIAVVVFGFISGNLVQMMVHMVDRWF